jgi:Phage integrase, N-terminal SAM-like domain
MRRGSVRKPLQRAADRRRVEHLTTNEIVAWLEARLATDPALRRSIKRVLAALRKAEVAAPRRRRRVG